MYMNCIGTKEKDMSTTIQNQTQPVEGKQPVPVTYAIPRVDIMETKDAYRLEAEMPGVGKEGLEVSLDGNELTILGRRSPSALTAEYLYRESKPTDYRRVFELDPAIDTAKIGARMEQGVLILDLPKSERVKPRKVTITD